MNPLFVVLPLFGALFILLEPFADFSLNACAALTLITLILWATNLIPAYLTSLIFFTATMLLGLAPMTVAFAGFTSSALWMIFAGLVLGCSLEHTGLALRMSHYVSRRMAHAPYLIIIAMIMAWGILLSFVMPASLGRIVLTLPIIVSLAKRFGFSPADRGYVGMILAAACGAFFPAFAILPSNVPNMVWMGTLETLNKGFIPTYTTYLLLHFPILGLTKAVLMTLLIAFLYDQKPAPFPKHAPSTPITFPERLLIGLLLLGLILWMTDFIHHIPPAWIGLAMAIVCLFPGSSLVPEHPLTRHIDLQPLIYVAGIISLGAVIHYSRLGDSITHIVLSTLPLSPEKTGWNWVIFIFLSLIIGLVATLPGIPIILTPLAPQMSSLTGLPLETLLMLQILGFSTVFFPYQSPPIMIAIQLGRISLFQATKFCLILSFLTLVLLFPLEYFWWTFLGWL